VTRPARPPVFVCRHGFSLIEMVISLAVISILLAGMTSAIVLASRALPSHDGPAAAIVRSARAAHQLRDELRVATELLNRTATSVTLNLPDRDADGRPEVITYAWGGQPGEPLTRAANGNPAVVLLDNLETFTLTYRASDQAVAFPGPPGEPSSEQLLSSFTANGDGDQKLKDDDWIGTQVAPNLPAGTTTWQISRALFYGNREGGGGSTITFELRGWNGNEPASSVLDSFDLAESTMGGSRAWHEAVFSGGVTFNANEKASVVLANYGGGDAGGWEYHDSGSAPTSMFNGDGDGDWSEASDDEELLHYIYGTYRVPGDDWTYTRTRVTAVEVTLIHASAAATTHHLNVTLPNAPEAAEALWEADFNADPTTLDANGDGIADWQSDGAFDVDNLDAGQWEATDTLRSAPDGLPLDRPFVLEFWLEDTLDNGQAGGICLWFDRDGGQHACLAVEINRVGTNQEIAVIHETQTATMTQWVAKTKPAGAAVHVLLAVDTANDTVGVLIDGDHAGSFEYTKTQSVRQDVLSPYVTARNSGVVYRHLRLATGGTTAITPGAYSAGAGSGSNISDSGSSGSSGGWWGNLFN